MRFSIEQILDSTHGELVKAAGIDTAREAVHFTWDSREVVTGSLYVALVGERVDGHRFVRSAVDHGAYCALVSHDINEDDVDYAASQGCAIVRVSSCEEAIDALASAWRDRIPAKVIGITGSVGKTTTKALTRDVLRQKFKTCATKGNFNNELGAPYTVLTADENCEMLVVEMGMQSLGEIAHICSFARPDIALITNVGTSHIEFLKTQDNIARAKGEIVEALADNEGVAFLPASCPYVDAICKQAQTAERGITVKLYGRVAGDNNVYASDIEIDQQGHPHFMLHAQGEVVTCTLKLRGVHNVDNACGAAGIGLACGLTLDEVAAGLMSCEPEAGRQEFKKTHSGAIIIDDTYNASPISMKASLDMLASYTTDGKKIAILGDMGELGTESESGHAEVGHVCAQSNLDLLICIGPLSAGMAKSARQAGMDAECVVHVDSVESAICSIPELEDGDIVLLKASHYMGLDRIVEGLIR